MGLISKLKLLIKTAKPAGQFINQVKGAKLKWKTIPFWVSILGSAISLLASLQGIIPVTVGVVITGVLTALYNIVRGLDKADQAGIKIWWKSTEFWVGALGIISTQIVDMQTAGVSGPVMTAISSGIAVIMTIAQNLGANQPEDVKKLEDPKPS